jgi:TIR domain/Novel STAND NTPase 1
MSAIFISHCSKDSHLAKEVERRLAHHHHHSVFLDLDPEKGIVAGQSWERTLYRKLRACRAVIALCTDDYLRSHWCFAEIALARMEGKHIIALQADPLGEHTKMPAILTEKQFIDLRRSEEEGFRRLWRALGELDLPGVADDWDPKEPPYLGLSAYQEEHAPVFFGREEESVAGIELLQRGAPGLIMVLGASGDERLRLLIELLERLREDPPPPLTDRLRDYLEWSLDDLRRICGAETSAVSPPESMVRRATPLVDIAHDLRRVSNRRDARVLLVVDQFEELLGREPTADEASRFLGLLRASIEADRSPVTVLCTMRSDSRYNCGTWRPASCCGPHRNTRTPSATRASARTDGSSLPCRARRRGCGRSRRVSLDSRWARMATSKPHPSTRMEPR